MAVPETLTSRGAIDLTNVLSIAKSSEKTLKIQSCVLCQFASVLGQAIFKSRAAF
jgi:hypothetical protein